MDCFNKKRYENEYFNKGNEIVLPKLVSIYFETKEMELAYYLAVKYKKYYHELEFYEMMLLMELGYSEAAFSKFECKKDDWYDFCTDYDIYWKHIVLFSLYFSHFEIPNRIMEKLEAYYDTDLVRLLEYFRDNERNAVSNLNFYENLCREYPVLRGVGADRNSREISVALVGKNKWKNWLEYNQNIRSDQYGMCKMYESEGVKIYSYDPHEVSASMHVIWDGEYAIVLDCGCAMEEELERIPYDKILKGLGINKVDAMFISHGHMDHYGSINFEKNCTIYMSNTTKDFIKMMSPELLSSRIKCIPENGLVCIDDIQVRFIPNGHIPGSVLMDIDWRKKKRIVYTGDFTLEDQRTVDGLKLSNIFDDNTRKVDVLITETTYGTRNEMFDLALYERIFMNVCKKYVDNGVKVFIPSFAIGRAQEVALLLKEMAEKNRFKIIIDGAASKITEYYQMSGNIPIIGKNIAVGNESSTSFMQKILNYDIVIASSGMMKDGSYSFQYSKEFMELEAVCFIKVGFIQENEHMFASLLNRANKNVRMEEIPLSAHANYESLIRMIEYIVPENLVLVHGNGIKRDAFS